MVLVEQPQRLPVPANFIYKNVEKPRMAVHHKLILRGVLRNMVSELIERIEVYPAEKKDGVKTQRVTIFYNCIGAFDVPDRRNIPDTDIVLPTRKGVAVSYAPDRIAV